MASWMNNLRNLGRPGNPSRATPSQPPSRGNPSSPAFSNAQGLVPPSFVQAPSSPLLTPTMSANESGPRKTPLFFREEYAGFIVKGNFMTLAAKPQYVEEGEWLAHQIVEQNRLLGAMVKCATDGTSARSVCTEQSCPKMTAGPDLSWAWMDTNRNPLDIPAYMYIRNIQLWVAGKIQDQVIFPTDNFTASAPLPDPQQLPPDQNYWLGKISGFPQRFESDIKSIYKHMFRCYAHLYWEHWLFFWDQDAHKNLNTCFIHFVNVGRLYGLLSDKDTECMQGLIDIWVRRGDLPQSVNGAPTPAPVSSASTTQAPAAGPASTTAAVTTASTVST